MAPIAWAAVAARRRARRALSTRSPRVGVARRVRRSRRRPRLHRRAVLEDDDAVGDARDDRQVVADEQQRHPPFRRPGRRAAPAPRPARSRRGRSWARPRSAARGRRRGPWRSPPAGAGRRRSRAGRPGRSARDRRAAPPRARPSTAARRAAPRSPRLRRSGSASWRPTRMSGSSAVSGSWKTTCSRPAAQRACSRRSRRARRSGRSAGASNTTLPRRGHPGRQQTHDRQSGHATCPSPTRRSGRAARPRRA